MALSLDIQPILFHLPSCTKHHHLTVARLRNTTSPDPVNHNDPSPPNPLVALKYTSINKISIISSTQQIASSKQLPLSPPMDMHLRCQTTTATQPQTTHPLQHFSPNTSPTVLAPPPMSPNSAPPVLPPPWYPPSLPLCPSRLCIEICIACVLTPFDIFAAISSHPILPSHFSSFFPAGFTATYLASVHQPIPAAISSETHLALLHPHVFHRSPHRRSPAGSRRRFC